MHDLRSGLTYIALLFIGLLLLSCDRDGDGATPTQSNTTPPTVPSASSANNATGVAAITESTGFVGTNEQEAMYRNPVAKSARAAVIDFKIAQPSLEGLNFAFAQMAESTDWVAKIEAAIAIQAIAHQLIAAEMPNYHKKAQATLGLSAIEQQIQASMLADANSPNNPGDGTWSGQTQALLNKRIEILDKSVKTAKELAMLDPKYNGPLVAADAVLKNAGLLKGELLSNVVYAS